MKSKVVLLVVSILLSTTAFAQKEELKTLKKIYAKEKKFLILIWNFTKLP